ncbi:unnamed protein product, partial [Ectocarpus fasciculatus]
LPTPEDGVVVTTDGPVTIVRIHRPQVRNAVDAPTGTALLRAFEDFNSDDSQSVAILTGGPDIFCSGFDLKYLSNYGASTYDPEGAGMMGPTRAALSKPVIAAVEGHAVAGGLELALWCDIRIASSTAVFGVYCRRFGVPLIDGGTVRLPRLIGESRAMDMILSGRPVAAEEALQFGLANRLVPKGAALEEAMIYARNISAFPQLCMNTDRAGVYRQWSMPERDALGFEAREGLKPVQEESVLGATTFVKGAGRGGIF